MDAVTILPYILSALTIATMILAGNKHRHTWALAMGNQVLWSVWIIASSTWGLIPMNIALWVIYARNHLKWGTA